MAWIFGLVVVIGFAWLMYVSESFRRFGFGVLALIGAGIALLWFLGEKQSSDYRAKLKRQTTAISAAELVLSDMELTQRTYGWWIEGTVLNRSPHPLRVLTLTVYLRDCPSSLSEQGCVTTGQDDARFYVEVPPGQARKLSASVRFEDAPPTKPGWGWYYAIREIEAQLSDTK